MFESQTMQVASFGSPLIGVLQIYARGPTVSHLGVTHVFETLLSRCRGEKIFESQTMQVASFGSPLVGELQIYGRGWERGSTPCILTRNNVLCRL